MSKTKTVSFGMFWQMYGTCTVPLPDCVDETDGRGVLSYIRENWDGFPLPTGSYVMQSNELDESTEITVDFEDGPTIHHGSPDNIMESSQPLGLSKEEASV